MSNNKQKGSRQRAPLRRFFSAVMVLTLIFAMALPALSVSAAESTIDDSKTGSITIYKYENSEELTEYGEYYTQAELKEKVEAANLIPMEDVTFSYLKVGEIAQSSVDSSTGTVTIGYSIDDDLKDLLESTGESLAVAFTDANGTNYYSSSSLQTALSKLTQTQAYNYISTNGGTEMDPTDEYGETYEDELPLGLYLIVETTYSSTVTVTTRPFFVSLPMTDSTTTGEGDDAVTTYEWIYDVTCYPKNTTDEPTIDKNVVEDGDESKEIDSEIGKNVEFIIRADVPSAIGSMNIYTITDTLSSGLTFQNGDAYAPVVRGLKADGTYDDLTEGTEYDFTRSGQVLTFTFDTSALAETVENELVAKYVMVEITYTAYLNENAVVGDSGNPNEVVLEYSTYTNVESSEDEETEKETPSTTPAIYTYAINLQKQFDGEMSGDFSSVSFELYRGSVSDANKVAVASTTESGTTYYYISGETDTTNTNYTIKLTEDGSLNLRGLEAGTYYLVETGTANGYNLLEEAIEIVITSNEGTSGESSTTTISSDSTITVYYYESADGTFAPVNPAYLYATASDGSVRFILPEETDDGDWVNFDTTNVWVSTDNGNTWTALTMYATNDLQWEACVGGSSVTDSNGTFGTITVNNQSGFYLPSTGGTGTFWFMAVGSAVALIAVVAIVLVTRKKQEA